MDLKQHLKHHKKTHLIFDLDSTIVRLMLPWEKCLDGIDKELRALDHTIFAKFLGREITYSDLQNEYVSKFGENMKKRILTHNEQFESTLLQGVERNTELINMITSLENYRMFVWSSNTKHVVKKALKDVNILDTFEKVVTQNDVLLIKPKTDGFKLIHNKKTPVSNYLFIGDSGSDLGACKALGIDFFHVTYFGNNLRL